MLILRVVRLSRRAPRCASSACTVRETLAAGRRRASAAFEKLPLSTTRTKTFIARKRSMEGVPGWELCGEALGARALKDEYYDGNGNGATGGSWGCCFLCFRAFCLAGYFFWFFSGV